MKGEFSLTSLTKNEPLSSVVIEDFHPNKTDLTLFIYLACTLQTLSLLKRYPKVEMLQKLQSKK